MSDDAMLAIRASFFGECEELMESLQDALVLLEQERGDDETVNVVFRAVHSIKGGAGAFGLADLVAFAHRFETVLEALRAGRIPPTAAAVRLFFQGADLLHDHIRAARAGMAAPEGAGPVLQALEALIPLGPPPLEEPLDFTPLPLELGGAFDDLAWPVGEPGLAEPPVWHIDFKPRARLYATGNEPLLILRALAALGRARVLCTVPPDLELSVASAESPVLSWQIDLGGDMTEADIREVFDFVTDLADISIRQSDRSGAAPAACAPPPGSNVVPLADGTSRTAHRSAPERLSAALSPEVEAVALVPVTVRVDLDRVDRMMNLVGELVINQAMLAQSVANAGLSEDGALAAGLEEFLTLTRDIQDSVMMIRAQPVKPLFQRMARVIREASAALGKTVHLVAEGEATEIDKTVIERLSDPLTHLVRNAVDHGIEMPHRRLAAGKAAQGTITLRASHRAGRVLIEIADDGAGIDRARVRALASARGLVTEETPLSDAEIDNILFMPGFSTTRDVSTLSGRGVGMDVVRSAITALGGRVAISSRPGAGTHLSLSLPLTLAVLDGMVVRVAGQTLVVPLSAIVETVALSPADIRRIGSGTDVLHVRGHLLPFVDLGARLGFRPGGNAAGDRIAILTAAEDGNRAALVVDAILEQRQVVIKGLDLHYGRTPGIAAATILGDGQVALILDPSDLTRPRNGAAATTFPLAG